MFCQKCGNQLPEGSAFCSRCGTKIVRAGNTQQTPDSTVQAVEPSQKASAVPVQTVVHNPVDDTDFKEFVDNHVRTTTEFKSAEDLLKNCKPFTFTWFCFGAAALSGLILGVGGGFIGALIGIAIGGSLLGYATFFIVGGIIRMQYRRRFTGAFIGDINIEELFVFLNEHLKHIHPYFHEWAYLTKTGLLAVVENAIAAAAKEVRICSEFGPKRKRLVILSIRPITVDAKPGEKLYSADATKNGFLLDARAAGMLGHGTLIRTAPILQAAMEYYLKSKGLRETADSIQQ